MVSQPDKTLHEECEWPCGEASVMLFVAFVEDEVDDLCLTDQRSEDRA
jgi:hypothetical protein